MRRDLSEGYPGRAWPMCWIRMMPGGVDAKIEVGQLHPPLPHIIRDKSWDY